MPRGAVLAPMAGYTEVGFRDLCAMHGAALTVTEMVSAKGLMYKSKGTRDLLYRGTHEKIAAVQLFGREPDIMAAAAASEELSGFEIIDINMGCPVNKVVKVGEGSALMSDMPTAAKVISACVKAGGKPVTVKFRLGFGGERNYIEFGKMCEDSGAAAIALHARTREQFYSGVAEDSAFEKLSGSVNIPVIASGDITTTARAEYIMRELGCKGVMVGRGALGKCQVFADYAGGDIPKMTAQEALIYHMRLLSSYLPDRAVAVNMRKHIVFYLKGVRGAKEIKPLINECVSVPELERIITESGVLDNC